MMLVPAMKLHSYSYKMRSSWALHDTFNRNLQIQSRATVCCNAATSTTPASNSSSDEPSTSMAMAKGELESSQRLKPSEKALINESSAFKAQSPPLSASFECSFSAIGSSPGGSVQSSSRSSAQSLSGFPTSRLFDTAFSPSWTEQAENGIERAIFDFRFLSLLAVAGSLAGSFLCFLKGCVFIVESYAAFYAMCLRGEHTGKVVLRLVEAVDVYLTGTVMLIFGMGLYGLFISNVATNVPPNEDRALQNSSLFGMFLLLERPKWMRIASLDELKTKLGHVVVMILLVKMFERSKAVTIATGVDLLSYSISIFLTSAALLVLRHLNH